MKPRAALRSTGLAVALLSAVLQFGIACKTQETARALQTFDDVFEQRAGLADSVITLTGRFMGWNGRDCIFPSYAASQETRSDWIFMVGKNCLYVTGGTPPGLSAMEETSIGKQIILDARVRVTHETQLLLVYVRSTTVSQ